MTDRRTDGRTDGRTYRQTESIYLTQVGLQHLCFNHDSKIRTIAIIIETKYKCAVYVVNDIMHAISRCSNVCNIRDNWIGSGRPTLRPWLVNTMWTHIKTMIGQYHVGHPRYINTCCSTGKKTFWLEIRLASKSGLISPEINTVLRC